MSFPPGLKLEAVFAEHPEKYEAFKQECEQFVVLDCGATTNLGGQETADGTQTTMIQSNINPSSVMFFDRSKTKDFRFGNDHSGASSGVLSLQTKLLGRDVEYKSHMMEGGAP